MAVLHAVVRGDVQGVGFRYFVRQHARELGIRGWVRNRPDGTVEVQAEGDTTSVHQLRELLSEGPAGARVTRVDDLPPGGQPADLPFPFTVLR
jgi:acylphosphatase